MNRLPLMTEQQELIHRGHSGQYLIQSGQIFRLPVILELLQELLTAQRRPMNEDSQLTAPDHTPKLPFLATCGVENTDEDDNRDPGSK